MRLDVADQIAMLAALYGAPKRQRTAPAAALFGLRAFDGRLVATIEALGVLSERFLVSDAADSRLTGLRDVDRQRVVLLLREVAR